MKKKSIKMFVVSVMLLFSFALPSLAATYTWTATTTFPSMGIHQKVASLRRGQSSVTTKVTKVLYTSSNDVFAFWAAKEVNGSQLTYAVTRDMRVKLGGSDTVSFNYGNVGDTYRISGCQTYWNLSNPTVTTTGTM